MFSCGGTVHANCAPAIFRLLCRSVVIFPPRATKSRFLLPRTSDLAQCALAKSLWCKNRSPNRVCVGAFPAWRTLLDSSNVPTSPKRFSFTIRKCHRTSQVKITSFFVFNVYFGAFWRLARGQRRRVFDRKTPRQRSGGFSLAFARRVRHFRRYFKPVVQRNTSRNRVKYLSKFIKTRFSHFEGLKWFVTFWKSASGKGEKIGARQDSMRQNWDENRRQECYSTIYWRVIFFWPWRS